MPSQPLRVSRALLAALLVVVPLQLGHARAAARQDLTTRPWRFALGDDLGRAAPSFDDSAWRSIQVTSGWDRQGVGHFGFGWYRTTVHPSAAVRSSPLTTLHLERTSSTGLWVYVDGVFKGASASDLATIALSPAELPDRDVVIAVRALCSAHESFVGYESCGLAGPVRFEPGSTGPNAVPFTLSTSRVGNLTEPGIPIDVDADVLNSTTSARTFSFDVRFGSGAPIRTTSTVASGARHRFTTPFSSTRRGPVAVSATLIGNGSTLATRTTTIGIADPPAAPDDRFGLNTLESDEIAVSLGTQGFGDPALAARAGASWMRGALTQWKDVESEPGRRDWDSMDALHTAAQTAGVDLLWNVLGVPYWALGYPAPNLVSGLQSDLWCPPKAAFYDEFVRFHAEAAARYPGEGWEIGNEPELPTNNYCWRQPEFRFNDAAGYAALLAQTNAAVHATDPSARVVTAALETIPGPLGGDPAFASRVMNAHAFDVFNIHIYSDESTFQTSTAYRTAAAAKDMLARRGLSNEVWGTEYGGNSGGSLNAQRLASTRVALQLLAGGADRVTYFYTVEYPGEPLSGTSLFDLTGAPRPALFSYLTMTRMLSGLPFTGVVTLSGVPAVRFSNGVRTVTAVWDAAGATIAVPTGAGVFDDWGNPVSHGATVTLRDAPLWLVQG